MHLRWGKISSKTTQIRPDQTDSKLSKTSPWPIHQLMTPTAPSPPPITTAAAGLRPPNGRPAPAPFVADLVLSHPGPARILSSALLAAGVALTPAVVDAVLKRLWNHAPKALLFYDSLLLLPSFSPSPSSTLHALDLAARLRHHRRAASLLARLPRPSPRAFSILAERLDAAGKPHLAVRTFLSMHRRGCPQTLASFNALLDVLCKSRRVAMASSLLDTFKFRFFPDIITYNTIAHGWCIVKNPSKAMAVLREMVEAGIDPSIVTYNLLLHGFFHAGQVKNGYKFFLQMKQRGGDCKPNVVSYTTVIHGLGLSGDFGKAKRVFDSMIGEGCLPTVATYNALIQVTCKKDDVENAINLFDEMLERGYAPNLVSYNAIIRGLCHVGKFDKAMDYYNKMKIGEEAVVPSVQTFNIMIRCLCEAGEVERGYEVFREKMWEEGCLPNLDTYNVLISGFFGTGKGEWMVEAGKLMLEMVERGFLPRRFMFNRVLNGLLMTGNQAFAKEILSLQSSPGRLPRNIRL